jgi:hypothetical protein
MERDSKEEQDNKGLKKVKIIRALHTRKQTQTQTQLGLCVVNL